MSEPARDLPVEQPSRLAEAVEDARRGVITHLTIGGQRVAVIISESEIEALRAGQDEVDAYLADEAMDERRASFSLEELEAQFGQ